MQSKKISQAQHAKRRAMERFGIEINNADFGQISKDIQEGKATFIEKQSKRVSIFKITYKQNEMAVAYDRIRKQVATFMPLEYFKSKL